MKNTLPLARSTDLVTQELRGDVLVYNLTNNKAMCLNPSVAYIWANCDGSNDISDLMNLFQKEFNNKIGEDFILLSLDELNKFDLIENYASNNSNRISRRKVLLNYALPLALLPLVAGVIAPTAANAASGPSVCGTGIAICSVDSDCNYFNSGIVDPFISATNWARELVALASFPAILAAAALQMPSLAKNEQYFEATNKYLLVASFSVN